MNSFEISRAFQFVVLEEFLGNASDIAVSIKTMFENGEDILTLMSLRARFQENRRAQTGEMY